MSSEGNGFEIYCTRCERWRTLEVVSSGAVISQVVDHVDEFEWTTMSCGDSSMAEIHDVGEIRFQCINCGSVFGEGSPDDAYAALLESIAAGKLWHDHKIRYCLACASVAGTCSSIGHMMFYKYTATVDDDGKPHRVMEGHCQECLNVTRLDQVDYGFTLYGDAHLFKCSAQDKEVEHEEQT